MEKPNVRFHDGQILSEEPLNKAMEAVDYAVEEAQKVPEAVNAASSAAESAENAASSAAAIEAALEAIKGSGDIPAATVAQVAENKASISQLAATSNSILAYGTAKVNYLEKYYTPNGQLADGGIGWGHTPHILIDNIKLPIDVAAGGDAAGSITYWDKDDKFVSSVKYPQGGTITSFDNVPTKAIYVSISTNVNGIITEQSIDVVPSNTESQIKNKINNNFTKNLFSPQVIKADLEDKAYTTGGGLYDFGFDWKHTPHIPIEMVKLPITINGNSLIGSITYWDKDDNLCAGYTNIFPDGEVTIEHFYAPANAVYVSISDYQRETIDICLTGKNTKWNSAKIGFLGDSITYNGQYVSEVTKQLGCVPVNYGVSSSTIAKLNSPVEWPAPFVDRYGSMDNDLRALVVFGGVNDFQLGVPMGEFNKYNSNGSLDNTFYGAMHTLCRGLKGKYPYIPIVFVTPMHMRFDDPNWTRCDYTLNREDTLVENVYWTPGAAGQEAGGHLKDYVNAIKEVCAFYSLPVIDMYAQSTINALLDIDMNNKTLDGTHPNDYGGHIIGDIISKELLKLTY